MSRVNYNKVSIDNMAHVSMCSLSIGVICL